MQFSEHLPLILLLGGILPLVAGPFLARWADRVEAARSLVDAFTAVSLGGIVVLHIWPHAFLTAGIWTLVGGLLGLLLPFLLHGPLHSHEEKIYPGFVVLAFLGLAIHAVLDGVALFSPLADAAASHEAAGEVAPHTASAHDGHLHGEDAGAAYVHHEHGSGWLLALAVILHRLPMGLAVWWFTVPILGRRFAVALLGAIGVATVIGFSVAGRILVDFSMPAIAVFEATIAGMLLHVVMGHDHGHAEQAEHHTVPWASALGTLVGGGLVAALFKVHPMEQRLDDALSFAETFMGLAYVLAPWLLGALVLSTFLERIPGKRRSGEAAHRPETPWRRVVRRATGDIGWAPLAASLALLGWQWTAWRGVAVVLWLAWLGWLIRSANGAAGDETAGAASSHDTTHEAGHDDRR